MPGKLIIVSAPSGAGKTTLVKHLLEQDFDLQFSISATSRAKRGEEKDGIDYHFLSRQDFKQKIQEDAFIEWEEVYKDTYYGTLKADVQQMLETNKNVIFDVDVVGGVNLKKHYKENALAIFVQPPSIEELEKRLVARSTDNSTIIKERVEKARYELSFAEKFDAVIVNDKLTRAKKEIKQLVANFLKEEK